MKKYIVLVGLFFLSSLLSQAQVAINNDGSPADASAMLEVKSTEKGFLPPRMTEEQRDAINFPATGLLIYQTNGTSGYYYYTGSNWIAISSAGTGSALNLSCIDYDGNAYPTFVIGNQVWMKDNLRVTHYRNGDAIPKETEDEAWAEYVSGAYCFYQNNYLAIGDKYYGALYNWYAIDDSRGLCPSGWHVPTDSEWTELTTYLGGLDVAGGKMKSISDLWELPNTDASNISTFSGLPGGNRFFSGGFGSIGIHGYWWSSSAYSSDRAWGRTLNYLHGKVNVYNFEVGCGHSVRCIRD